MPVILLIGTNLIPAAGVLFLGWDVGTILVLYWLESVIIGLLNIPKILAAKDGLFSKLFTAVFFSIHFGGFCAGHGVFLKEMFDVDLSLASLFSWGPMTIAAASMFISHFVSMMVNFFGKKEYAGRRSNEQMFMPYGRVIVMHITILIGGLLAQQFGAPVFALLILIALKTFIDLLAHSKEHKPDKPEFSTV